MPEDEDVPGGGSPAPTTTIDPWARLDADGVPRVDSLEHIYGIIRVGGLPNYVPSGTVTAAAAGAEVAAAHLLDPEDDGVWQSPGVSDQADAIRLDLPASPAPRVSAVVLHEHNLSLSASIDLRGYPTGEDPDDHADMVVLPVSELARGGGVTGLLADAAHGVDAWTDAGLTVPVGNAVLVRCAAPPAPPRAGAGAGLIRLRLRLAASGPASDVELELELRQSGGTYATETVQARAADLDAGDAGGIVMVAVDPGDLLDPAAAVDLQVLNLSGPSIVIRELDVVVERVLPAGVYRSGWRPAIPQPVTELDAVIRASGGYVRPPSTTWWLTTNSAEAQALGLAEPEVDPATPRTAWEIRVRDGANADGYLEARSILAGGHLGTGSVSWSIGQRPVGLVSATLRRHRPVIRQQLLSGGERRVSLGPSRRRVSIGLERPLVAAAREIFEGLAAAPGAVAIAIWPANQIIDDALTVVGVLVDESTDHQISLGHPHRFDISLEYLEI